jgi:prepilin signal peptidase PulO-like enzyme (type II secretory pathway)
MLVELLFAAAMAGLYAWEVGEHGLVAPQSEPPTPGAPTSWVMAGFALHFVLSWLMLVASLVDLDEKTIPDTVTVPGTLLGLVLATLLPMGLLPNIEERPNRPAYGAPLPGGDGRQVVGEYGPAWVEPTHLAAPNDWPDTLAGGPTNRSSLVVGLGCYGLWCFALAPRVWRTGRGAGYGLAVLLRRVGRALTTRPLREILLLGLLGIATVWLTGGAAWEGLLSSLVGMAVSGGIVWGVRIVGSAALGREAMGFGDVTLMMMVGAFVGWQAGLLVFFLAPFAAVVIAVGQLVLKRDDEIPYGPFLCLATAGLVTLWGTLWPRTEALFGFGALMPVVLIVCLGMLGVLLAVWRQFKLRVLGMSEDWGDDNPAR